MNKSYSSALLAVVVAGVVTTAIQPTYAASKSNKLADALDTLEAALSEASASLTDEEAATVYAKRYTTVNTLLNTAEQAVYDAKAAVPYVLFANVKEKATMYAALQDIQSQLLKYEYDVAVINGKYDSTGEGTVNAADAAVDTNGDGTTDTTAVEAANDELTTTLNEVVDYLSEEANQAAFSTAVKEILKEKLDASLVYDKTGLAALKRAETAYEAMGQDTAKLVVRLEKAQEAYDAAKTSYDTGTTALDAGDTTTAVQNFNQAARRMVVLEGLLLSSQKQVDSLEAANSYAPVSAE
jgi:hypothetical protein